MLSRNKGFQLFSDLLIGDTGDGITRFERFGIGATGHCWIFVGVRVGAPEGRVVGRGLVSFVPVLGGHREDVAERAAFGANPLKESVDQILPVSVVVARWIPVDRIRVVCV